MLDDNHMEVMHDECSAKSFLQSDGGSTDLLSIKTALEELEGSLKVQSASADGCPTHTDQWNSHNLLFCVSFASIVSQPQYKTVF